MSEPKVFEIIDNESNSLKGLAWEVENASANVFIFQGMEEYSKRYDYFAKKLNEEGYNVYGLDCYGQGLNAGENLETVGMWPKYGFNKQIDAYDKLIMSKKADGKPSILFCHSMGSYMGQGYIQKYSDHIDHVVLCGSGAKNPAVPVGYVLASIIVNKKNENKKAGFLNKLMFGNFNNKIKEPKTAYDWLSIDEENVTKYIADPLCGFGPRNKFCLEFLRGMKGLYSSKGLNNIRKDLPIFIITGEQDPVTTYSKATSTLKRMYDKLGIQKVETKIYKPYRHEILNEKEIRDEVIKDIIAFYKA